MSDHVRLSINITGEHAKFLHARRSEKGIPFTETIRRALDVYHWLLLCRDQGLRIHVVDVYGYEKTMELKIE